MASLIHISIISDLTMFSKHETPIKYRGLLVTQLQTFDSKEEALDCKYDGKPIDAEFVKFSPLDPLSKLCQFSADQIKADYDILDGFTYLKPLEILPDKFEQVLSIKDFKDIFCKSCNFFGITYPFVIPVVNNLDYYQASFVKKYNQYSNSRWRLAAQLVSYNSKLLCAENCCDYDEKIRHMLFALDQSNSIAQDSVLVDKAGRYQMRLNPMPLVRLASKAFGKKPGYHFIDINTVPVHLQDALRTDIYFGNLINQNASC